VTLDPEGHHRRRLRLKGYDYAQDGAYYVTICTQNRLCLFGDMVGGKIRLNTAGSAVQVVWNELPRRFARLELDAFVVMPNHIHGIAAFVGAGLALPGEKGAASSTPTQGDVVDGVTGGAPTLGHADNGAAGGVALGHTGKGAAGGVALGHRGKGAASSTPTRDDGDDGVTGGAPTLGHADNGAAGGVALGHTGKGAASSTPTRDDGDDGVAGGAPTLGDVVRAFKSLSAIRVNRLLTRSGPLWQRNYYEHIIRDEDELNRIRDYITNNPMQWELDRENPAFRDAGAGLKPAHTKDDTWR
jgi:putative transposase